MARRRSMFAALGALLAGACSPVTVLSAPAPRESVRKSTDLAYAAGGRYGIDLHSPEGLRFLAPVRQDVLRFVAEATT